MNREDNWTAAWVAKKVFAHSEVIAAEPISGNALQIMVKERSAPFLIATVSIDVVEHEDLDGVYSGNDMEFIINIPRDAVYRSSALSYAERHNFGLGGLKDLYVALNEKSLRSYISKETRFILRGLLQHTKVSGVDRITDRLYDVHRYGLRSIKVLALNEYDLTAEAVRVGIERHGECDFVLASNPNCRPSSESIEAAQSAGARVLKWAQLLGALNNVD